MQKTGTEQKTGTKKVKVLSPLRLLRQEQAQQTDALFRLNAAQAYQRQQAGAYQPGFTPQRQTGKTPAIPAPPPTTSDDPVSSLLEDPDITERRPVVRWQPERQMTSSQDSGAMQELAALARGWLADQHTRAEVPAVRPTYTGPHAVPRSHDAAPSSDQPLIMAYREVLRYMRSNSGMPSKLCVSPSTIADLQNSLFEQTGQREYYPFYGKIGLFFLKIVTDESIPVNSLICK